MTPDMLTHLQSNKGETLGSMFIQECIQIPMPTTSHERYV